MYTVLSYLGVVYLFYMLYFEMSCVYCCSCLVCIVILRVFAVLCVLLLLIQMPDCWLEVSTRKVLRPATSTQVFLGFPVPISKC